MTKTDQWFLEGQMMVGSWIVKVTGKLLKCIDMLCILILVIISWVYTSFKVHCTVYIDAVMYINYTLIKLLLKKKIAR